MWHKKDTTEEYTILYLEQVHKALECDSHKTS